MQSEHHQQRMRDVVNNYAAKVGEHLNVMFENEVGEFIKHVHGDNYCPDDIRGIYEQCYQDGHMALCTRTKTCTKNEFPFMEWQEQLIPHILFKNWNNFEHEIEVERLWQAVRS